jgi:multidrug transporter EmrE-like cation transporter
MLNPLLFAIYTMASVSGLLLLKSGLPALRGAGVLAAPRLALAEVGGGGMLYVVSFGLWMVILSRVDLSVAYPITIGLTITCIAIGSVLLFGEALTPLRLGGMALVFIGIALIVRS